jgi:hypothetical protein
MANEMTHPIMGEALNLKNLLHDPTTRPYWSTGNYNVYGRLFQGHKGGAKGMDTCFFIHPSEVPKGRIPAYVKFVCAYKPHIIII